MLNAVIACFLTKPKCVKLLLAFFILTAVFASKAQTVANDSALYITPTGIRDGIYLNYSDFRKNQAIYKAQINSQLNDTQLEFLGKVTSQNKVSFTRDGVSQTVDSKEIWGFFQNNTLHVNYKGDFYRVPVFGAISYLVAKVEVPGVAFYDAGMAPMTSTMPTNEIREFLMNFYNGDIAEFTMKRLEELLSRDLVLYAEFKKLSRKKRHGRMYQYIRKYNELHPVYYLK